jgi:ADP-heptose:LPS heptosyltransferase
LPTNGPVLDFVTHAPHLVQNEYHPTEPNHFLFQSHRFLASLLGELYPPKRATFLRGSRIYLEDTAVDCAEKFVENLSFRSQNPILLLNPDTASPFTKPPEVFCKTLLLLLTANGIHVLIGEGHTDRGIGQRLLSSLPPVLRDKAALVPSSLSATAYAALIDRVGFFVSGDTGPLHWAAARKESTTGLRSFANRTSVFALFGATPARMSGYDSQTPGFLPAWQNAVSRTFVSKPACRNLTCLGKLYKTCRSHRCFEGLSASGVATDILQVISSRTPQSYPHTVPLGV